FLATALLFWFPVIRPFPSRPRWSSWLVFPYLILADVQNTLLAAWLAFADRPLYSHYATVPRVGGVSALDDQAIACAIMWVPGSMAFLLPLVVLAVRALGGQQFARQSSLPRMPCSDVSEHAISGKAFAQRPHAQASLSMAPRQRTGPAPQLV